MRNIVVEGSSIESKEQMHAFLQEALELPEHYGRNLDALWDCLAGYVELPLTVTWLDYEASEQRLGEYGRKLFELFEEAAEEIEGFSFVVKG
ncbi:barstar family protein [Paenibacillus melissococcoides]|uniref:Barstar family protein n=1 Tax=Paenibacillus melissococcoides TaxID=2912268 RepID=A0ABM9FYI0_9BACL|nr:MULTISPECIES: barstar family protein [Paenibacillus]MEB9893435.1 barstar family protein [Bacillus cereus]CAH8244297.1 barstar family protein [Paenibacillus melissococcoides]CAH8703483.1 barstar family protein [Paenibacillus melissococcoides]CAH8705900.1 barstar family protein [Paenibacillus melissococcoides]GIO77640.1 putative ribonuclease inhibitor YrdF [Paenibacillus dendritiformis]